MASQIRPDATDCLQEIRLNFQFPASITSVSILNPANGQVQTEPFAIVSGRRQHGRDRARRRRGRAPGATCGQFTGDHLGTYDNLVMTEPKHVVYEARNPNSPRRFYRALALP